MTTLERPQNKTTRSKLRATRKPTLPANWDVYTPEQQALALALADPDAPVPMTFREFVDTVKPDYQWYRYALEIAAVLQLVADGWLKRVMIFAPPQLGKSELVSRIFPAYCLYRFPHRTYGLVSYGADLAHIFSRASRMNYREARGSGKTGGETEGVEYWETGKGGGLWAVGANGAATGKPAFGVIIDDPIKGPVEATSEITQARAMDTYDQVIIPRTIPHRGFVVLVQTRWNLKDVAGRLLEREAGDAPDGWTIVNLQAIYDPKNNSLFPETCDVIPDWRELGESVCPERMPLPALYKLRINNVYAWNAQYQQNPTPHEGGLFKRAWFETVPQSPAVADIISSVRSWDLAATQSGGDYTVGVRMVKARSGLYYVTDVVRAQLASGARDKMIKQVAINDRGLAQITGKPHTVIIPQDPGQAGKSQSGDLRRLLDGHTIQTPRESGDKELRAGPMASAAYAPNEPGVYGRIKIVQDAPEHRWNEAFLEELASFPYGNHDDQVDAAAGAYAALTSIPSERTDLDASRYPVVRYT